MKKIRMLFGGPCDDSPGSLSALNEHKKESFNVIETSGNEKTIPFIYGDYVYMHSIRIDNDTTHEIYFWRQSP